jgi:hypothetical protein
LINSFPGGSKFLDKTLHLGNVLASRRVLFLGVDQGTTQKIYTGSGL